MKLTDTIEQEYGTLNESTVLNIKRNVKKTKEEEVLLNAFLYFLQRVKENEMLDYHNYDNHSSFFAENTLARFQNICFSSEDITYLTVLMTEHSHKVFYPSSGVFLTKLISNHFKKNPNTSSYTLILENQKNLLYNLLSVFDGPTVHIFGDVGDNFCNKIENGTIFLHGNVYGDAGEEMYNGSIQIFGNVMKKVGKEMINGSINISGNVHNTVGTWMKNGKITVQGNVESSLGMMQEGGEIVIGGNVKEEVGNNMRNGKITIKGNTQDYVGRNIKNGSIYLERNYPRIFKTKDPLSTKGRIYHKEKQIFPEYENE